MSRVADAPTNSSTPTTAWLLGTRGDIAEGWSYDAYGQYYYTSFSNVNGKDFSFEKIANALQVTGTAQRRCLHLGWRPACRTTSSRTAA